MVLERPRQLRLHTMDVPAVGPDEAVLEIELAGVCGTDYKFYIGALDAPLPIVLGHEILGRIHAIGDRAAQHYGVGLGDRVTVEGSVPCWSCTACHRGAYRFCGAMRGYGTRAPTTEPPGLWGAMAEYMFLAPGSIVHRAAESIAAETAIIAGLVANGVQWLSNHGRVRVGDTVLIQGAGPQGLAATAVAHACGAAEIIVTGLQRDRARLELAREIGATDVVVADIDDCVTAVRDLTCGRLVDVALDVTGSSAAIAASVELVRPQGTFVLAGLTGAAARTSVELDRLVWNEIRLQGVFSKGAEQMQQGIDFLAARGDRYPLDKIVSHVLPLDEAERAIQLVADGSAEDGFIKAAVRPGG
jgi:alcohol dehydrogenase